MRKNKKVIVFETGEFYCRVKFSERGLPPLTDKIKKTAAVKKMIEIIGEDVCWCGDPVRGLFLHEAVIGNDWFKVVPLNLDTDLLVTFKNQRVEDLKAKELK